MTAKNNGPMGHDIGGKKMSSDEVIKKVIDSRSRLEALMRVNEALKKDRDQLLEEYNDIVKVREIKKSPRIQRERAGKDTIRVSVGDVHGMRMDRKAVDAFLEDVKILDPDEVVLGGDVIDCGGWLAKHQPIGFVALSDYSYQEDINAGNWFLDSVQETAPRARIHYIEGNHEDRVERWCVDQTMAHKRDADFLRRAFAPQYLLRLEERGIKYYRRSEIYEEGAPRGWMKLGQMFFTHSLTYSKNAARDAAIKTGANVTYFCTHREDSATVVFPGVGIVKAFNPGCLAQMQPVWKRSDPTNWSQGYAIDVIAKNGHFQRIHIPIWRGESLASAMINRFRT